MSFPSEKELIADYKNSKVVDIPSPRAYGKKENLRPPVPLDPPTLFRIYKNTAQRVKLAIHSLRSDAVFLLVCDEDKQVLAWFGSESSAEDRELALKIGLEVTIKDYSNVELEEIPVILEDLERSVQLRYFLDKLWEDEATYRSPSSRDLRRHRVINSPVTLFVIEKIIGGNYIMKELKRSLPDEYGTVPRISFAPIEKDSIVAVSFGEQWDLWVARGSIPEIDRILAFLSSNISPQAASSSSWDVSDNTQNIRIVKQGCERRLFRLPFKLLTNFEPVGKTIPYAVFSQYDISDGKMKTNPIEESTESSEYDEFGNRYDDYYQEEYDEYGNRYDDYYDESQPYDESADQYDPTHDMNASFNAEASAYNSPSRKSVTFDDVSLNPMSSPMSDPVLPPTSPSIYSAAPSTYDVYDDIPAPSILTEMRDRKKNPGKYMLSQESLTFREDENVGPEVRMELFEASLREPRVFIGWQVSSLYHK
jgi:hypothetical protein